MITTTYSDLMIWNLDQKFIEDLSESFDIAWEDIELYIDNNIKSANITNQIINWLFYKYTANIKNEDLRDEIQINIYTNCFDSWINDIDGIKEKYKNKISENDLEILNNLF